MSGATRDRTRRPDRVTVYPVTGTRYTSRVSLQCAYYEQETLTATLRHSSFLMHF